MATTKGRLSTSASFLSPARKSIHGETVARLRGGLSTKNKVATKSSAGIELRNGVITQAGQSKNLAPKKFSSPQRFVSSRGGKSRSGLRGRSDSSRNRTGLKSLRGESNAQLMATEHMNYHIYDYSFKDRFQDFYISSGLQFWFDVLQMLLSVVACVMYLYESYDNASYAPGPDPKRANSTVCISSNSTGCTSLNVNEMEAFCVVDLVMTLFFALDYLIHIYLSEQYPISKLPKYSFTFMGVVDLLTILPLVLMSLYPDLKHLEHLYIVRAIRVLRALRVLKIYRLLHFTEDDVSSAMSFFAFTTISIIFIATGMFQVEEQRREEENRGERRREGGVKRSEGQLALL
jgi:hypothetical protein